MGFHMEDSTKLATSKGVEMEAYRIDRFGSVDGIVLRSSDHPRPRPEAVLESPKRGGLEMRLVASRKIPSRPVKRRFLPLSTPLP
jgi:hypothetical protein